MSEQSSDGEQQWMGFECVSCGTTFVMFEQPKYCTGCGRLRNEGVGRSEAEANPDITAFKRHPIQELHTGPDQEVSR